MTTIHDNFNFKSLGMEHLDEIYLLLNQHYIEDNENIIRIVYSKDFLYWYLRKIPPGLIIGLVSSNRLVGMVTARIMDMKIDNIRDVDLSSIVQIPYINFLCVQKNLRGIGLSKMLCSELQTRLTEMNFNNSLFKSFRKFNDFNLFSNSKQYIVPINCSKLAKIGLPTEHMDNLSVADDKLHLLKSIDISSIVPKLELETKSYAIRPVWTAELVRQYLLPKKNIVYSFVIKNSQNEITDFISVYQYFIYCLDVEEIISVAHLAYYFCTSISLTQMINCLVEKLKNYKLDGLMINDMASNNTINITKFEFIPNNIYYYSQNPLIHHIQPDKICVFPF